MSVDRDKLENLLKQLPEELQHEVLQFAESMLRRNDGNPGGNGTPSVRSLFGIWDSGNPHSADNDSVDVDIASEYDIEEQFLWNERARRLREAIRKQSVKRREVLTLCLLEGYSSRQVAEIMVSRGERVTHDTVTVWVREFLSSSLPESEG